jgi:hypothetical protein
MRTSMRHSLAEILDFMMIQYSIAVEESRTHSYLATLDTAAASKHQRSAGRTIRTYITAILFVRFRNQSRQDYHPPGWCEVSYSFNRHPTQVDRQPMSLCTNASQPVHGRLGSLFLVRSLFDLQPDWPIREF